MQAGSSAQPCNMYSGNKSKAPVHTKTSRGQQDLDHRDCPAPRPAGTTASQEMFTHMMQPMDQMSTSKLCPFLPSTSGAM